MGHLGVVLYEYLGEEYPEVLGSILGALKSIVNVIGMTKMTPPIKDLLPRLTPILKNRSVTLPFQTVMFKTCKWDERKNPSILKNWLFASMGNESIAPQIRSSIVRLRTESIYKFSCYGPLYMYLKEFKCRQHVQHTDKSVVLTVP